jgi:ribose 5-phosphate isomerase B
MNKDTIYIGNDHGGYETKVQILKRLDELGIPYVDCGCHSTEIVRYPYYAAQVSSAVSTGKASRGILICSTGIGMSIMANKYPNVRASVCTSTYMGRMTRAHNNSNILCLGGKITGIFEILDILNAWLTTDYDGGRHAISLGLMAEAEECLAATGNWEPEVPEEGKQ